MFALTLRVTLGRSTVAVAPCATGHAAIQRLNHLSPVEIAGALGVSTSSASKFRRGLQVPAPRHWATLRHLVHIDPSLGNAISAAARCAE